MSAELKSVLEEIGRGFEDYKGTNDERLKKLEEGHTSRATELEEKLAKQDKRIAELTEQKRRLEAEEKLNRERIEELEARNKSPGKTMEQKLKDDYQEKFLKFVRGGLQDAEQAVELKSIEKKLIEQKDVTIGTPGAGGYAVPEQINREVEKQEKLFSPVMEDIGVTDTGTSDWKELVNLRGAAGGWAGETTDRTNSNTPTATPTLREVVPTNGEQYAWPQVSEWSLDDIFFDVASWLTDELAETFAIDLATAVVSGNGSSRPTGMLNTTPTTVADFGSPLRSAAVYQYVASDVSPVGVSPDTLIDLVYTLNSRYRMGAKWIMNSTTTGSVRKLKDTTNQYLWQPGLQAGQPDMLLGYPVSTWEQMPDIGSNAFPIGFGNLPRAYRLVRRVGMRITRDDVTKPGYVRFYVRRRVGGIVRNNNALKFLRTV